MNTREIPRDEWRSFFDVFSKQHEGWLATLEICHRNNIAQPQGRELPFEAISITATADKSTAIAIDLGKSAEDYVKHAVIEPTHAWLVRTPEGLTRHWQLSCRTYLATPA